MHTIDVGVSCSSSPGLKFSRFQLKIILLNALKYVCQRGYTSLDTAKIGNRISSTRELLYFLQISPSFDLQNLLFYQYLPTNIYILLFFASLYVLLQQKHYNMSLIRVLLAILFPPLAVIDKGCGSYSSHTHSLRLGTGSHRRTCNPQQELRQHINRPC